MLILSVTDIQQLISTIGLKIVMQRIIAALQTDFKRWHEFSLSSRHATHYPHGVIELMPCADQDFFTFKYVNGHPANPAQGKLSVVAIGQLSDVASGYPLMISEMTLLTALRTAATAVLAAKFLARKTSSILAIIGCGAQAEFQITSFSYEFSIKQVRFFDNDVQAMAKLSRNLSALNLQLVQCASISDAILDADIIITATAIKQQQALFAYTELAPGAHIHAMGGDCPGKTELGLDILTNSKVIVEYKQQSLLEGDVQQGNEALVYAELWELVCGLRAGRENDQEITVFDSVGFALEDYSILRVVYALAKQHQLGTDISLIPSLDNPKDLFALLSP